jgi:sortase (surface protein transpeptidase)
MKYNFRDGVEVEKKKPTWIIWVIVLILLGLGAYWAATYLAPHLISMPFSSKESIDATMQKMQAAEPSEEAYMYLPQLNVDLPIVSQATNKQVVATKTDNSVAPDSEGVLVIKAPYFNLGSNPWESWDQSPFYNLDKLEVGGEVYVDYKGKRYAFVIKKTNEATIDVESQTDKTILVLVPTDKAGNTAKSTIVIAESKGVVATRNGESL